MCSMSRYLKEKRRYIFSSIRSYTQIYRYLCTLIGKEMSTMWVSQWINSSYMDTEKVGWSVFYSSIMIIEVFKCSHYCN